MKRIKDLLMDTPTIAAVKDDSGLQKALRIEKTTIPLIAGGLIPRKQDVIQALQTGVIAVSTSCQDVWEI